MEAVLSAIPTEMYFRRRRRRRRKNSEDVFKTRYNIERREREERERKRERERERERERDREHWSFECCKTQTRTLGESISSCKYFYSDVFFFSKGNFRKKKEISPFAFHRKSTQRANNGITTTTTTGTKSLSKHHLTWEHGNRDRIFRLRREFHLVPARFIPTVDV